MPVLGMHIPLLGKFSETETFKEWNEQFDLVASVCGWDPRAKLTNLVARLQGQAYSFYQTCSAQKRSSYEGLKEVLFRCFNPVHLQSVQSGLFH